MIIRATTKLLKISRISPVKCDLVLDGSLPGEWYASLLSTGRMGGSVIHLLHNPTMVSVFVQGKSLRMAVRALPERLEALLGRNGFGELFADYMMDTECKIFASDNRSVISVMVQMRQNLEGELFDIWEITDEVFVSLEDYCLDYLIGGQISKHRGKMCVSAREILEQLNQ
jgi:hypothetical protein